MKTKNQVANLIKNSFDNTLYIIDRITNTNYNLRKINNLDNTLIGRIIIEEYISRVRECCFTIKIVDDNSRVKHKFIIYENSDGNLQFYKDVNLLI